MPKKNIYNDKDSMDINELASLNDDISPELIDQLQEQLAQNAQALNNDSSEKINAEFNVNDDTTLFEEPAAQTTDATPQEPVHEKKITMNTSLDDNFIKKYKAKLNKQKEAESKDTKQSEVENSISNAAFMEETPAAQESTEENIEKVSKGNITEHAITQAQKNYNDSLDFLDGNVKYSKYVIYIDPQNVDFIDSLTVKERKNLINKILREQDDIAITKKRFRIINTIIKHAIVAILTITISVPVIYWTINASLEATINNYRHSQTVFQTLYRENGKISSKK